MKIQTIRKLTFLVTLVAGAAQAQESNVDLSVGIKAWHTQWTTWGYNDDNTLITQAPAKDKTVFIPLVSVRYRDFVGSVSGFIPTDFELLDGTRNRRKEFDLNAGYVFTPGVAASIGYKRLGQSAGGNNYELGGLTLSLSGTAPLSGPLSLYGTFGFGRMKDTGGSNVHFDADYQLSEVGFAYNLALGRTPKVVAFTLGYRMQVLNSKDALPGQDARDLTQGFTLGVIAVF